LYVSGFDANLIKKSLRILVIHQDWAARFDEGGGAVQTRAEARWYQGSQVKHSENSRMRILLVEDSEDNRFMMKRLLEMSGYEVVEASNGEQAVNMARLIQPDLILMDLSLPKVDGLAATRRIRQFPALKNVPVVVVSAHDTADFHAEALASGCNEYVTKPIDFGQLEVLLKRLVPSSS
jgi:two-component system cell cycle response regulator DivK